MFEESVDFSLREYSRLSLIPEGRYETKDCIDVVGYDCIEHGGLSDSTTSNERDWTEDQVLIPQVRFDGDTVIIENVRDFQYRSTETTTESSSPEVFKCPKYKL